MAARTKALWTVEWAENVLFGIDLCDILSKPDSMDQQRFHAISVQLWLALADTARRKRLLRERSKRRKRRWRQSPIARRASAVLRKQHLTLWANRAELLEERAGIIKQVGDALVWSLAWGDPRFVMPLYKRVTHELPTDHSVDGVLRMLETAAGTSEYAVVPTDLTRCCGTGDFLIRGATWPYPSPFEAKIKRQPDGTLLCMLHGWHPIFQVRPEELEKFKAAFGLTVPTERVAFDERGERQKVEVRQSTSDAKDSLVSLGTHADPSVARNWGSLEGVIERAAKGQTACDVVEPGLAYAAAPIRALGNPEDIWAPIVTAFKQVGIDVLDGDWDLANSLQFIMDGELSPVVTPIPMWKIPPRLKSVLMAGQVVLVTASRKGLWKAAFRAQGVELGEEGGIWKMSAADREQIFDEPDVIRLKFGLRYAGISPRHTAKIVAAQLQMPGLVHVDRYGTPDSAEAETT